MISPTYVQKAKNTGKAVGIDELELFVWFFISKNTGKDLCCETSSNVLLHILNYAFLDMINGLVAYLIVKQWYNSIQLNIFVCPLISAQV
jgi:hypothetical protein